MHFLCMFVCCCVSWCWRQRERVCCCVDTTCTLCCFVIVNKTAEQQRILVYCTVPGVLQPTRHHLTAATHQLYLWQTSKLAGLINVWYVTFISKSLTLYFFFHAVRSNTANKKLFLLLLLMSRVAIMFCSAPVWSVFVYVSKTSLNRSSVKVQSCASTSFSRTLTCYIYYKPLI